jgi:hypothetical protein
MSDSATGENPMIPLDCTIISTGAKGPGASCCTPAEKAEAIERGAACCG